VKLLLVLSLFPAGPARSEKPAADAFRFNRSLGRGVNLGNMLEAPHEGAWGLHLKPKFLPLIKQAGFDSVRIPIRWSAHASKAPPFTIDPAFFQRVDQAVEQALSQGLVTVINVHHYEELYKEPDRQLPRFESLWRQIARRYRDRPERLYFELLNEPHGALTDERWQNMVPRLLAVVRKSNPNRIVIVGPGTWNNLDHLGKLKLPEEDRRLIVTFHYYSPFQFTHQGASWAPGSRKWLGKTWGSADDREALRRDFDRAAAWGKQHRRPLFLGEFGAYSAADMDARARWTRAVAREAERHGFSWAYWEFASGFGVYDPTAEAWRRPLRDALLEPGRARP
jgi:endoglucanase